MAQGTPFVLPERIAVRRTRRKQVGNDRRATGASRRPRSGAVTHRQYDANEPVGDARHLDAVRTVQRARQVVRSLTALSSASLLVLGAHASAGAPRSKGPAHGAQLPAEHT